MRYFLLSLLIILFYSNKAQMCNTAPTSMGALAPTTTWQNTAAALGAKRYWTFNATAGCTYDFSSCNGTNTNDTYLRLYSGTNPLTAILQASNDDNGVWCTGVKASLSWVCGTSGAYSILLTNFSCANLSQNSTLSYRVTCPVIPANNNCANAIAIASLPYTSPVTSNVNSTDDVPTSTSGCGTQGSNVWYTVVGNNNQLTATTCNASTNFDTEVRVYTGSCASLNSMVEIGCNDDDGTCVNSSLQSTVTWCSLSGTIYYISVGYWVSGAGYGNFVLSVTNGAICSTLPIELIDFSGYNKQDYNYITWTTATEINNDYFTLERSNNGIDWNTINIQKGAGTSLTPNFYEYKDYTYNKENINYYRLSQTDYNKQIETFKIIYINSDLEKNIKCVKYEYFDLLGHEINIENVSSGLYLRKCGDKIEKIFKN